MKSISKRNMMLLSSIILLSYMLYGTRLNFYKELHIERARLGDSVETWINEFGQPDEKHTLADAGKYIFPNEGLIVLAHPQYKAQEKLVVDKKQWKVTSIIVPFQKDISWGRDFGLDNIHFSNIRTIRYKGKDISSYSENDIKKMFVANKLNRLRYSNLNFAFSGQKLEYIRIHLYEGFMSDYD